MHEHLVVRSVRGIAAGVQWQVADYNEGDDATGLTAEMTQEFRAL